MLLELLKKRAKEAQAVEHERIQNVFEFFRFVGLLQVLFTGDLDTGRNI